MFNKTKMNLILYNKEKRNKLVIFHYRVHKFYLFLSQLYFDRT